MNDLIKNYLIEQNIFYECLLLEYYYSESNRTFTWVGRTGLFTNLDLSKNPFLKICFTGVSSYRHIFKKHKNSLIDCHSYFSSRNHIATFESHNSYLKKNEELYEIEIEMTYWLGSIFFQFEDFFIEVLYTEVKKVNNTTFIYSNAETKKKIDFYQPFGEIRRHC